MTESTMKPHWRRSRPQHTERNVCTQSLPSMVVCKMADKQGSIQFQDVERPRVASHDSTVLDLAFVMDCTSSMGRYIRQAQQVSYKYITWDFSIHVIKEKKMHFIAATSIWRNSEGVITACVRWDCFVVFWIPNIWWRHQVETYSALLVLCVGNSPVTGEFPAQRPVTRSFWCFLWSAPE